MFDFLIKEKFVNYIFFLILIIYPLTNLIYNYFPEDVYGVNLYSLICFVLLYFTFCLNLFITKKHIHLIIITILFFLSILIVNFIIHPTNSAYIKQYEIGITFFIINILCFQIINNKNTKTITLIIILSCLTQAIFSIINEFITYNEITFFNYDDENRQTGFLLNANLFSSFILLGLILSLHQKRFFGQYYIDELLRILLVLILFSSIFVSESRFSIYMSIFYVAMFIIYNFYKNFNSKKFIFYSFLFIALVSITALLLLNNIGFIQQNRISMGFNDSIRVIKYYLGFKTILLNPIDLFFGMDRELFTQLRILNTRLSDNSIIYLIMYFGIPYTCFLFFSIYYVCILYSKINFLFVIIFTILIFNLFLTGAIFWQVYLLYFSTTSALIFKKIE